MLTLHQPKEEDKTLKEEDEPRVFELKRLVSSYWLSRPQLTSSSAFYQQRLQKKRQAEAAKRDRERASQPNYFPSVPNDLPSK
jgi:hypothetical protein